MNKDFPLPRRPLGRTGEQLSVVGFGAIVVMNAEPRDAADAVAWAVDHGVNYFDVAPSYGDAQDKLGPALEPHRDGVFLACKTACRDAAGARAELEGSLRALRTDCFDLYQLHALTDLEKDVAAAFAPGGAMETLVKARDEGLVRHLGFSAHSPAAACRAMELFDFDSILYPVNFACHHRSHFDQAPLDAARARGMGILALKAMARGPWEHARPATRREDYPKSWYEPLTEPDEARMALAFTLAQPGLTALLPPGVEPLFRMAVELVAAGVGDVAESAPAEAARLTEPLFA